MKHLLHKLLEYIELARGKPHSARCLGQQLAALHRTTSHSFGWHRDNTIGSTLQQNTRRKSWSAFYRQQRLRVQFDLAARNGFTGALQDKGERVMASMHVFFATYQAQASLLHGDLWAGNCAFDARGAPLLFDPWGS